MSVELHGESRRRRYSDFASFNHMVNVEGSYFIGKCLLSTFTKVLCLHCDLSFTIGYKLLCSTIQRAMSFEEKQPK